MRKVRFLSSLLSLISSMSNQSKKSSRKKNRNLLSSLPPSSKKRSLASTSQPRERQLWLRSCTKVKRSMVNPPVWSPIWEQTLSVSLMNLSTLLKPLFWISTVRIISDTCMFRSLARTFRTRTKPSARPMWISHRKEWNRISQTMNTSFTPSSIREQSRLWCPLEKIKSPRSS